MNVQEAIAARRSIRKFKNQPIPEEALQAILEAAILAPSGHNRQPWRLVVFQGERHAEMIQVMREGIANVKAQGGDPGSCAWTANAMESAPVDSQEPDQRMECLPQPTYLLG